MERSLHCRRDLLVRSFVAHWSQDGQGRIGYLGFEHGSFQVERGREGFAVVFCLRVRDGVRVRLGSVSCVLGSQLLTAVCVH